MDDGHIDDSPTDDASSHHIISTYLRTDRDVTIPRIVKNWAVMSEVEDAQVDLVHRVQTLGGRCICCMELTLCSLHWQVMQLEADKIVATLAQLWKARSLVDTVLVTGGGETHHAHALMLCASSGYVGLRLALSDGYSQLEERPVTQLAAPVANLHAVTRSFLTMPALPCFQLHAGTAELLCSAQVLPCMAAQQATAQIRTLAAQCCTCQMWMLRTWNRC